MARLIILGAGGHGRVAAEIAEMCGWAEIASLDTAWQTRPTSGPWPVIGNDSDETLRSLAQNTQFFVGLGDNSARSRMQLRIEALGLTVATLIHPSAVVSRYATIGAGCLIGAGSVVNYGAALGKGVIVNTHAGVDHDCNIGAFCHIAPAAHMAADVVLGEGVFLGIGASVRNGITIGAHTMIGAGAAVVSDISDNQTVVGVPARSRRVMP